MQGLIGQVLVILALFGNTSDVYVGGTLTYNEPRWEDLRFPSNVLRGPPGGAPFTVPSWVQFPVGGTTPTYLPCMRSDVGDEGLIFVVQMPHSRKDNSDLAFHIHWAPSTAAAGTVVWQIECTPPTNIDACVEGSLSMTFSDATDETANKHHRVSADGGAASGANTTVSAILVCSIFRDISEDNYGADACLIEVDVHVLVDTPGGSKTEFAK